MKTKELKEQVLKETINHYNNNNRSVMYDSYDGGFKCAYEDIIGNNCAIGRLLTKSSIKKIKDKGLNLGIDIYSLSSRFDFSQIFQKKYKPLYKSKSFLNNLQILHDEPDCWNENGISSYGIEKVKSICKKFKLSQKKIFNK